MLRRDPLADVESLIDRVYAYVAFRIGDGPDAEDVTSDVFERALRYRHSYNARRGEPISWLIGIARRCIADAAGPIELKLFEDFDVVDEVDLEAVAVDHVTLAAAVDDLGARDRELIALRYGADLTARQIGELLGDSTNAVEVALHRALRRLRKTLEPADEPPLTRRSAQL
jgi:RNA polymerase sigma-70 factor (ECF subfamily)